MWFKAFGIAALIGLILWAVFLLLDRCRRLLPGVEVLHAPLAVALKKDETLKVQIDTRRRQVRYAVRVSSTQVETRVIEEVRHASVVIKDDGTLEIRARPWGFCLEPGLGMAIDQGPRAAADLQFLYYRRLGVLAGAYYHVQLRPYIGASYALSKLRLFNTSLWLGVNLRQEVVFGARLSF